MSEREGARGGRADAGGETGGERSNGGDLISRWEWLTAAVGLLLLLAAVGYMAREAVTGDDVPPYVVVAADSVTTAHGVHQVHFTARNEGGRAAAAVTVEGRLSGVTGAAGEAETSEATLDYVPGRSERAGGLFFRGDPRTGRLELRAHGYAEP